MTSTVRPVALGAGITVLVVAGFVLGPHLGNLHNGLIAASFGAVGLYVVKRKPAVREGWLFVATGAAHAWMFAAREYGLHAGPLPGASWVGWLGVWPLPLVLVLVGVTVMCFPDGRLPSPGWRPVVGALAVIGLVLSTVSALWPVEYARTGLVAPHPLRLPGNADAFYEVARGVGYLLFQVTWVVCVVVRLRRARGDEARQLRVFVFAAVVSGLVMVAGLAFWGSPLAGVLSVPLVAVAAGGAILKYRLYDIDPVINKALVFAVMAGLVTLGYAAVVTSIGRLVHGYGSLVATALVAVAFEPLRRRVQRLVDRLVYGHRATAYEALARLSSHLAAPAGRPLDSICQTVSDGVGAREVVLWAGTPDELRAVSAWPEASLPAGVCALDDLSAVPIVHDGRFRGALAVTKAPGDPLSAAERRLVGEVAAQAGLILELQGTAARLVAAGDAARRRLERDLHDGAQQHLVTASFELGSLVRLAEASGDVKLAGRAAAARTQLLAATAELREMARGLHPAVLTEDGLEAAVDHLADRSAVPVRVHIDVGRRLPAEVEATAYFVVSEGLTNAAKHAGASVVRVEMSLAAEGLAVDVTDDGGGGATVQPGSGLEGLTDRLATLGARLRIDSGPSGTRLATVIPCA
ncbi:sensor histidine kinase [Cryptosporangium sp. NPDC048952]|uniref:sensor histidine kinase n=1 Tax=Cryptosporangium sp. NPDC048952 TaxID=3363961 RepID=UPI00371F3E71